MDFILRWLFKITFCLELKNFYWRISISVLYFNLNKFDAKHVNDFNCRNETESHEKSQNSANSSDKSDLSYLFFSDILRNVGVLDVDCDLGQVLSGVVENFFLQFFIQKCWNGLKIKRIKIQN